MHLRWLQCFAVLSVCGPWCWMISPVFGALKDLDDREWETYLLSKTPQDILVLLYAPRSEQGAQAEKLLESMVKNEEISQVLPGVKVMKQKKGGPLSEALAIKTFPSLVLIRDEATAYYLGNMEDPDDIMYWLGNAGKQRVTKVLTDDTFEHLTQASTGSTTGHWAVLFYRAKCQDHFAVLESLGVQEKMWMNVATVNLDESPKLAKRFKITECPELIYFREGKMYRYETRKYDLPSLNSFVTSWFRNVKASGVPLESTAFDELTEGIARYIKVQLEGENRTFTLAVICGFVVTVIVTSVFCCITGGSDSKRKTE